MAQQDLFLFAGQSNMIGWSTGIDSIEGNRSLLDDTIHILKNASITETERQSLLLERYQRSASSFPEAVDPTGKATNQSIGIMRLYNQGLTRNLTNNLPGAYCSFLSPNNKTVPKHLLNSLQCGESYGHELAFSHRLKRTKFYSHNKFQTVKVAKGGTRIQEWVPDGGQYWEYLTTTIQTTPGQWKLIVWHQGENDAVAPASSINATTYADYLSQLISNLRSEMFTKSPGSFQCPQEIPVVIVRIHWPNQTTGRLFAAQTQAVKLAQTTLSNGDARARLVILDDIEEFYHLSAPSLLISGNRIANAYLNMIKTAFTCPRQPKTPANSSSQNSKAKFRPDYSKTHLWGRAVRKVCGCGTSMSFQFTKRQHCVRRALHYQFHIDVTMGLVRSPQNRRRWHQKARKAYHLACRRRMQMQR
jgi:hypothetical protein